MLINLPLKGTFRTDDATILLKVSGLTQYNYTYLFSRVISNLCYNLSAFTSTSRAYAYFIRVTLHNKILKMHSEFSYSLYLMCGIYVILNPTFIWEIVVSPVAISESLWLVFSPIRMHLDKKSCNEITCKIPSPYVSTSLTPPSKLIYRLKTIANCPAIKRIPLTYL